MLVDRNGTYNLLSSYIELTILLRLISFSLTLFQY